MGGVDGSVVVFDAFGAEDRWFESHSSHHVGTLGKFFTRSFLYDMMCVAALGLNSTPVIAILYL